MIRLAHVSDIHVTARRLGLRFRDMMNKRMTAYLNLRLGRGRRFTHAERILAALAAELRTRGNSHIVFSGEATNMGLESELRRAVELLGVADHPGIAVPGNHDYLTRPTVSSGVFENQFARWQQGERLDEHVYPFAQRVGHLWLVGVNSARSNRWIWDATGEVGHEQLSRLDRLLRKLPPGPRVLVTHYPICLANGKPETKVHGLVDLKRVLDVAVAGGVILWLHGHRHSFYFHQAPAMAPFPVICVGSSTQTGRWSYADYRIEDGLLQGLCRVYDKKMHRFRDGQSFTLRLPKAK
jgi:3',5'-cyclic AMP phosphodiesterase CpdA